ncbi:PIG-L family deacetylase [Bacillus songklensis]|uniref:PIG-L family deacetylase n=1 Tax=Bacillus songklensis TaxID=1069116 RepID=A0ABV8B811_9BACI
MATMLAVFAHPDDETFICGGTLAKYAYEGHRVVLVCATKGEMGRRMGIPPAATRESLPVIREQELKKACEALRINDLRFLGIRDKLLEIQPFDKLTQSVLDHMIDVKPAAVITFHETLGGHPDHCTIGLATTTAFQMYQERTEDYAKAKLFYVCWPEAAQHARQYGLLPEQITKIEVKPYNSYKLQAFRAHKTQSEIDKWVWKRDKVSLKKFPMYEYFIQAHAPYHSHTDSLL